MQFWGVLGTWVASIGTVAAVITSLWFALHQNAIKLEVTAGHRIIVTPGRADTPDYCCIRVVNIGLRPAKITNVVWYVKRFRVQKQMVQMFGFPGNPDIPQLLMEGDEVTFMIPFHFDITRKAASLENNQ